jgi:transglutaminase superfamily protein
VAHLYLVRGWADVVLRRRGALISFPAEPADWPAMTDDQRVTAGRCARAINRAATYGPLRARCLARSFALNRMLRRNGIDRGIVRIGIRIVDSQFYSHAWVELAGEPLGESAPVSSFVPLNDTKVQTRAE